MANRMFQQFRFSIEKAVGDLYGHVFFGPDGEPTLEAPHSKGILSMTRTGTGAYLVVLQDTHWRFLMANAVYKGQQPGAPRMYVAAEALGNQPEPSVSIQVTDQQGVAADPADGDQLYLQLSLSNSSAW